MVFQTQTPWFVLVAIAAMLVFASWRSWRTSSRPSFLAIGLRAIAIALLILALANPQRSVDRPIQGQNVIALLADDSSGMRIKDQSEILDRGEHARQVLQGRESAWRALLEDEYQLRSYRFSRSLQRVSNFDSLSFAGQSSNLSTAITALSDRLASQPLAGVVVFTDGNATDTRLSDLELAQLPPIFPVVIGSENAVPDLSLQDASIRISPFGDAPLELEARLQATELRSSRTVVELASLPQSSTDRRRIMESREVQISEDTQSSPINIDWPATGGGIEFYQLTSRILTDSEVPTPEEATSANNGKLLVANRGKENYRILYLTGRPNWEYKFLNRSLQQDPQLDMVGLLRVASKEPKFEFKSRAGEQSNSLYRGFGREDENERYDEAVLIRMNTRDENELRGGFPNTAETLFEYDAVILDDVESEFFTYNQLSLLRDFVRQRGGGLLMLGGVNSFEDGGYQDSPLSSLLPFYADSAFDHTVFDRPASWDLSREGWVEPWMRIRDMEMDERNRISNMPLFRVYNTLGRIKPGARQLATVTEAGGEQRPALLVRNFGSGRVASLAVGDLWRWGMQDTDSQEDLAQFWRQISRWLVKDNPQRISLSASITDTGATILQARALNPSYQKLSASKARLSVTRVASATQPDMGPETLIELDMQPVSDNPGHFQSELPQLDDGAYLAEVLVEENSGTPAGRAETGWTIDALSQEFSSISPNRAEMERIAAATGGQTLSLSDLAKLNSLIQSRPAPASETVFQPIWHNNLFFLAALAALLAEWLIRRKRGLA
ncbi:glutamine amidotransferase [Pelagicoccus albus]|uniref:Putative glutamine amidotransferase domain-containing protein n=1 Tax=Pelagicoccus albus TaxID=415222 RepID=A0A7X1B395_9BACT|nr:glutamine amidotransferase [Pelagicoccus albus]MBC2604782.1 hypothetical protein [Pelagicoccus albus]